MRASATGILLIKHYEQCRLKPYRCSAKVPTIGWGNTFYPNGKKVTLLDKPITQQQADQIFDFVLSLFEREVSSLLKVQLPTHQFDAVLSFAYNVGTDIDQDDIPEGLGDSTLLKLINANPRSTRIAAEFKKWNKAKGVVQPGLIKRRAAEADYYTTGILKF